MKKGFKIRFKLKKGILLFFQLITLISFSNLFAQRVVSVLPSYTEIIFELGAGDNLVGVTNFCNKPKEAEKISKVGDYLNPDIEAIYRLRPDIIFIGEWKNNIIEKFSKNKRVRIVVIPQEKSVEDIYTTIKIIAKYLGKEKKASEIIKKMKDEISKAVKVKKFKKVYVEVDRDMWTCGSSSFISDIISKAGGVNIFNDINKSYFKTSWEEVIKRNPDVIILMSGDSKEDFLKRQMSDRISAVKSSKVFVLSKEDRDIISRPTPSIVSIIKRLSNYISDEKN